MGFFFKNRTSKISWGPRACRENQKNFKKYFFLQKFFLFFGWNWILDVLSFILMYISSVAQNFQFRLFLAWKFSFLTFVIWQPFVAKVLHIGGCFGCLCQAKDQIYLGTSFGYYRRPFGHLEKPKISPGHNGPPQVITSFQSSGGIGLTSI